MDRNELTDRFLSRFNNQISQLQTKIKNKDVTGVEEQISSLKREVNDAIAFLPPYNCKVVQSSLSSIQKEFDVLKEECKPVKKFSFGRTLKPVTCDVVDSAVQRHDVLPVTDDTTTTFESPNNKCISDRTGEEIIIQRDELKGQCLVIKRLSDCNIRLLGPACTLHLEDLTGCRITSAPVQTSARVVKCTNCMFSLAGQQIRIDSTTDCEFRVLSTSGPIIENSSGLKFGCYRFTYPELESDLRNCDLYSKPDKGRDVQDFNWLSGDRPSPNWSLMDESPPQYDLFIEESGRQE